MHSGNTFTQTLNAMSFVGALAAVGIASHVGSESQPTGDVITGSYQSAYEDGFKAANPLSETAINLFGAARYVLLGQASAGAVIGDGGWIFSSEELEIHQGFQANIETSLQEVAYVKAALEAKGVRLLTVIVPDKAEIYADRLGVTRPAAVQSRRSTFVALLKRVGVEAYDAAPVMMSLKTEADAFIRDDTHWSPAAAKAVAGSIAERLSDIERDAVAVTTMRTGSIPFDGDLLSFLPTGPLRPYVGPAQNTIGTYETKVEAAGGLFGDRTIDFVLVGTSFSAKPAWHFEGFLKNALQADVLNVSLEGKGPFVPMDAFLNSETFKTTPPKVVIWEIPVRYISKELN